MPLHAADAGPDAQPDTRSDLRTTIEDHPRLPIEPGGERRTVDSPVSVHIGEQPCKYAHTVTARAEYQHNDLHTAPERILVDLTAR